MITRDDNEIILIDMNENDINESEINESEVNERKKRLWQKH